MTQHIDQLRTRRCCAACDEAGQRESRITQLADQMRRAAEILRRNKDLCANMMSAEQKGKSIADSEAEIESCAWACDLFAALSRAGSVEEAPRAFAWPALDVGPVQFGLPSSAEPAMRYVALEPIVYG
jgi:acyl-CoA reductase-like NAD-dependent aldehyde dehydrogenase